jgi:hypothetical protein
MFALAAEQPSVNRAEPPPRDDGDPVIALLAVNLDVPVARFAKRLEREVGVRAFGFLQAEDVGHVFDQEALYQADTQADGVDVPGSDREGHLGNRQGRRNWRAALGLVQLPTGDLHMKKRPA